VRLSACPALTQPADANSFRMKQFIERTLDDMNHGRSLKQSLEALGLAECVEAVLFLSKTARLTPLHLSCSIDDVVPGLNIHLMPHQVIGVSWCVSPMQYQADVTHTL
jgi:hypothetical protein